MKINTVCSKEHFLDWFFTCCVLGGSSHLTASVNTVPVDIKWLMHHCNFLWTICHPISLSSTSRKEKDFADWFHFTALVGSRKTLQTGLAKFDCISVYSGAQLVGCSVYYDWKAGWSCLSFFIHNEWCIFIWMISDKLEMLMIYIKMDREWLCDIWIHV
jgi:hypothetical protein